MNNYMNPYSMPTQQILQANGIDSARQIRLAPNSSALIADATMPIVYRCIADSMGVVNVEAFDIAPHKQVEQQTMTEAINEMNARLRKLEENYESIITRNESSKKSNEYDKKFKKSASIIQSDDAEQSKL